MPTPCYGGKGGKSGGYGGCGGYGGKGGKSGGYGPGYGPGPVWGGSSFSVASKTVMLQSCAACRRAVHDGVRFVRLLLVS